MAHTGPGQHRRQLVKLSGKINEDIVASSIGFWHVTARSVISLSVACPDDLDD